MSFVVCKRLDRGVGRVFAKKQKVELILSYVWQDRCREDFNTRLQISVFGKISRDQPYSIMSLRTNQSRPRFW